MPKQYTLDTQAAVDALADIAEILWPGGDTEHEWDADTLDLVARAVRRVLPPEAWARVNDTNE
jgi:hypothetical protein